MKYERPSIKLLPAGHLNVRGRRNGGAGANSGCGMCKVFK